MTELPIGRRVAYWRGRRKLSQQSLADALGKSKSWVDKVERGVRRLDKLSVLQEIASTLRIDVKLLLGDQSAETPHAAASGQDIEAVRAALSRHEAGVSFSGLTTPPIAELDRSVRHAWLAFQHADYRPLIRGLPMLLRDAQLSRAQCLETETAKSMLLLGQTYQVASAVLRKIGASNLAWLTADRAMALGRESADELLTASSATHLGYALLSLGWPRQTMEITIAVAHRIAPPEPLAASPEHLSVYGTLLLRAALGAADCGDQPSARELLDQAGEAATQVGEGSNHHWTAFGPTVAELARAAVAGALGEAAEAIDIHRRLVGTSAYQRLPPERRADHLIDLAGAFLQTNDLTDAGRALLVADRTAPAEVRARPVAHEVMVALLRRSKTLDPQVARLADAMGVGV